MAASTVGPMAALLVVAAALAAAVPSPPVYPLRWQANESTTIVLVNGQHESADGTSYFDGPNNRTMDYTPKSMYPVIVTNWNENGGMGKEYYIRVYGNPPVRHCEFWCEPDVPEVCDAGDSLCSYDYQHKAKYRSTSVVNGLTCDEFAWMEGIGPIPMNELYLYTLSNAASPIPVRMVRILEPLGKNEGNVTIDFTSFAAVTDDFPDSLFDLGPDAKYECSDPEPSQQCQDVQQKRRFFGGRRF